MAQRPPRPSPEPPPEATFAGFFDALHEGLFVGLLTDASSTTLTANAHLRLIFGWAAETPLADVRPLHPDRFIDPQARQPLLQQLARDGQVEGYLLRLRRSDDTPLWIELTARAESAGRDGLRVSAVLRDVTERKRLDDQAREVFQQLAQAERLASLGQTMSGVAHELNNPLATILACAERLNDRDLDERTRRDLDAIHNAAERAARIVRNLQTFARKRHTTRTTVDLNQVVRDTIGLRAYEHRASNITVVPALAAGLPVVFADPHQIQQILLNLIINAEQAMLHAHGRGTLVVRSWHDHEREAVLIEVSDDGPGVPEEVQSRIFDPFFTTKAVGKGTGLGLTVAYAIAQEHGGRLTVDRAPDRGASFVLELPVSGAAVRMPEPPASTPLPPVRPDARALVVEDERALGDAVAAALADEGFRVDLAGDGAEALDRIASADYDLIVCDLKMPRVDGMTFFAELTVSAPQLTRRIVFVTGDVAGTDAERFLDESGCRWIAKPFRLRDLVRAAKEIVA